MCLEVVGPNADSDEEQLTPYQARKDIGNGFVKIFLPDGASKRIHVAGGNVKASRTQHEATGRNPRIPMFLIRYDGQAYLANSFELDNADVYGIDGTAAALPGGTIAFLETHDPIEITVREEYARPRPEAELNLV